MRVVAIDYGMGNLGSVTRAAKELGAEVIIAEDPAALEAADGIILPGVGGFSKGMAHLRDRGWIGPIRVAVQSRGKPILGICLGMQLFATSSSEGGETEGLGLIPGRVERLDALGCGLRVPHVGWNSVEARTTSRLLAGIANGTDFYFVHSYALSPCIADHATAVTDYGVPIVAVVENARVYGTQFHPEKSSRAGLRVLVNFLDVCKC